MIQHPDSCVMCSPSTILSAPGFGDDIRPPLSPAIIRCTRAEEQRTSPTRDHQAPASEQAAPRINRCDWEGSTDHLQAFADPRLIRTHVQWLIIAKPGRSLDTVHGRGGQKDLDGQVRTRKQRADVMPFMSFPVRSVRALLVCT